MCRRHDPRRRRGRILGPGNPALGHVLVEATPISGHPPRGEKGASAIQVGLLLIGPIVVASTLAAAVMNAGTLVTNRFNDTTLAALGRSGAGLELRGAVSLRTDRRSITAIVIDVDTTPGSAPIDFDPATPAQEPNVTYIDEANVVHGVPYTVEWLNGNGDALLDANEIAELTIDVRGIKQAGASFTIEVRPAEGIYLSISRQRPTGNELAPVIELY
jgi:archaellin